MSDDWWEDLSGPPREVEIEQDGNRLTIRLPAIRWDDSVRPSKPQPIVVHSAKSSDGLV